MKTSFYNMYRDRMNDRYRDHVVKKYWPFIIAIRDNLPLDVEMIAEFGCGAANISRLLPQDIKHILVDSDPDMLYLADLNMRTTRSDFIVAQYDIVHIDNFPSVDLIHSHGVLEHFQDDEIRQIIMRQKKIAPVLVHYVPSYKYVAPSFGTERLMTPEQWDNICHPDEIRSFNDGYDLILIWKRR